MNRINKAIAIIEAFIAPLMTNGIKSMKAAADQRTDHLVKYYSSNGQTKPELKFRRWRIERNRTGFYSPRERQIHLHAIDTCLSGGTFPA